MQPNALRDLLDDLLAESVTAVTLAGASAPPERRYVAHGSVTWDCPLLAVLVQRIVPRLADSRNQQACAILHDATVAVTLLRCYPVPKDSGTPPSADDLSAASRDLATDGQALWKGLTRAWAEGSFPTGIPCSRVTWGGLEPLAPSGGLAGWRVTLTVRL